MAGRRDARRVLRLPDVVSYSLAMPLRDGARSGPARDAVDFADLVIAGLGCAATALYVVSLPRNLGQADESVYLYEAKRILEGAVLYRDVFEITTPGWLFLMAALFRAFGVDLATARATLAVLHGVTAAILYLTCRRLGVRRGLSWPVPLAYLAVCASAWPVASQHWLGTTLCSVVLFLCAGHRRHERPSWALGPGLVLGLLIGVQQARGITIAAGMLVWLLVDRALRRRYAAPVPPLLAEPAWLAGGVLMIVLPLGIFLVARAGVEPVWRALVLHPLINYRAQSHCPWGLVNFPIAPQSTYTFPRLLAYLPVVLVAPAVRLIRLVLRREDLAAARRLALLLVFSGSSIMSILYFPDFIHIAFIASVLFVVLAESVEWAVRLLPASPVLVRACGVAAGVVLALAGAVHLQRNLVRSREAYRFTRQTAFGRVDLANPVEAALYDRVQALPRDQTRELFCYPIISHLYLMLDARNPTPYQFVVPGYTAPDQIQDILTILDARQLPYVVALPGLTAPGDPIMAYIERHYAPLATTGADAGIYRRRDAPAAPSPDAAGSLRATPRFTTVTGCASCRRVAALARGARR
jgi:hypothetical protein